MCCIGFRVRIMDTLRIVLQEFQCNLRDSGLWYTQYVEAFRFYPSLSSILIRPRQEQAFSLRRWKLFLYF